LSRARQSAAEAESDSDNNDDSSSIINTADKVEHYFLNRQQYLKEVIMQATKHAILYMHKTNETMQLKGLLMQMHPLTV
jgi:hypothetical protein